MKLDTNPSYRVIDTKSDLNQFADGIKQDKIIAVDLEADSMFHFREKVCLLQMAAEGKNVVIDPIAIKDLSPLKQVFKDPGIKKVFHGSDYDVRSLFRDFEIEVNNLLDTQLASMFLGIRETSLEAVVKNRFGIALDKKYQKKDWSLRPLPEEMIAYAASDVGYLIQLAEIIIGELKEKGRLSWIEEECHHLSRVRPNDNSQKPLYLRFKGAGRLDRRNLAVLEALLQYRTHIAEKKDRPLFKIISNLSLKNMAVEMPETAKQLQRSGALSKKQIQMYGAAILETIETAKSIPEKDLPIYPRKKAPRRSPAVPRRFEALKTWRDGEAEKLEIDPALLFNKSILTTIAIENPRSMEALSQIQGIRNWQINDFGERLLQALPG